MTIEELQKKNKQLLELIKKYDKFAEELKIEYISEIECSYYLSKTKQRLINEARDEFNVLREELRSIKND